MIYKNSIMKYVFSGALGGVAYGVLMGLILQNEELIVPLGAMFAVLFIAGLTGFSKHLEKKMEGKRQEIAAQRRIICEGPANHKDGSNSVGGWLFLTEFGLEFYPHNMNFSGRNLAIPVGDIVRIEIKGNKLVIYTRLNYTFTFVVNKADSWQQSILYRR